MVPASALRPSVAPTRHRTTSMAWSPERMPATSGPPVMNSRSAGYHGLLEVVGVVLVGQLDVHRAQHQRGQGEALALETGDHLADQAARHRVRLDQHQGALGHVPLPLDLLDLARGRNPRPVEPNDATNSPGNRPGAAGSEPSGDRPEGEQAYAWGACSPSRRRGRSPARAAAPANARLARPNAPGGAVTRTSMADVPSAVDRDRPGEPGRGGCARPAGRDRGQVEGVRLAAGAPAGPVLLGRPVQRRSPRPARPGARPGRAPGPAGRARAAAGPPGARPCRSRRPAPAARARAPARPRPERTAVPRRSPAARRAAPPPGRDSATDAASASRATSAGSARTPVGGDRAEPAVLVGADPGRARAAPAHRTYPQVGGDGPEPGEVRIHGVDGGRDQLGRDPGPAPPEPPVAQRGLVVPAPIDPPERGEQDGRGGGQDPDEEPGRAGEGDDDEDEHHLGHDELAGPHAGTPQAVPPRPADR